MGTAFMYSQYSNLNKTPLYMQTIIDASQQWGRKYWQIIAYTIDGHFLQLKKCHNLPEDNKMTCIVKGIIQNVVKYASALSFRE